MSHAEFILTYDGPAMAAHEMNVRDLAPAMLAVGGAFEGMNALFNGKSAQLAVNVRTHQPGCFKVAFDIVQIAKGVTPMLTGPGIAARDRLRVILRVPAKLHCNGTDRYQRCLCRVTVNGRDVGDQLVREGRAVIRDDWR